MQKSFLFLYLRTGGGHLAPAKAVASALTGRCRADCTVTLHDGLEGCSRLARYCIEDGYRILQSRARWYYAVLYQLNKFPPLARISLTLVSLLVKRVLRSVIVTTRPDRIVLFHFFLIRPAVEIVRELQLKIPLTVVVTDPFTAHPMWFMVKEIGFIVFSDRMVQSLIGAKVHRNNIQEFPFPVSDLYSAPATAEERIAAARKFGLDSNRKTILIFGGGDGIPRGERIFRHLLQLKEHNLVMVCGKNTELLAHANAEMIRSGRSDVLLFGYVDFVRELLALSDVVISKCGASTFKEILLAGRIPVVTDYIWEQEKGNVDFLVRNRLGFFEPDIKQMEHLVRRLLDNDVMYAETITRIVSLHRRSGSEEIAEWLLTNTDDSQNGIKDEGLTL